MYSPTYGELKANLQKELDLEDETFVTPIELMKYANEAVEMISSSIHSIYEDYYKTEATISLVSGQALYDLPSDIYAQKIRHIHYNDNGTKNYEIKKVKQIKYLADIDQEDAYQYDITNSSSAGLKIKIYPTPQENSSNVTIYYLRNAKRFTADADVCDIPEFSSVLVQYMRWKCLSKEVHPDTDMAARDLERMRQEMVDTLTARIPDEEFNLIPMDASFYRDFDDSQGVY